MRAFLRKSSFQKRHPTQAPFLGHVVSTPLHVMFLHRRRCTPPASFVPTASCRAIGVFCHVPGATRGSNLSARREGGGAQRDQAVGRGMSG